jgi:hypothetical protein
MPNPASDTAPGDVTAPPVPPAPLITPYGRGLQISVGTYTKPVDFLRYRYYKAGVSGVWRESDQPSQIDYDTAYGTTYTYAISAIDTSLPPNESAQGPTAVGTPDEFQTPDINDGAVTTPKVVDGAVTTPKVIANAITGGATHISDTDVTTTSNVYVNMGSEVQFTISSSLSPLLITYSGSVLLRNVSGAEFMYSVTVAICKATATPGAPGDNQPLQELTATQLLKAFNAPFGAVIEIPFSMHYTDQGPVGLDGYRMRFRVDGSGFSRAESLSRRTMQVVELKR